MTAGITNPQFEAGGLQIRLNEGIQLAQFSKKMHVFYEKSCLKQNILYFCGKINSKTP